MIRLVLICAAILALATPAIACGIDADCRYGSKCVRPSGYSYGICIGGRSPGNDNDAEPMPKDDDPYSTFGDTCTGDYDCNGGESCVKSRHAFVGACVPDRF